MCGTASLCRFHAYLFGSVSGLDGGGKGSPLCRCIPPAVLHLGDERHLVHLGTWLEAGVWLLVRVKCSCARRRYLTGHVFVVAGFRMLVK